MSSQAPRLRGFTLHGERHSETTGGEGVPVSKPLVMNAFPPYSVLPHKCHTTHKFVHGDTHVRSMQLKGRTFLDGDAFASPSLLFKCMFKCI